MRRYAVALALSLCAVPFAAAQRVRDVPPRPPLGAGADTNSAGAYYEFGRQRLRRDPSEAAAAFYWAARLNPEAAEYPYARRVALMLTDPRRLVRYYSYDRLTVLDPEVRAIDSLILRAMAMDPFFHQRLDEALWIEVIKSDYAQAIRNAGGAFEENDLEQFVQDIADRTPGLAARIAYSRGRFPQALDYWGRVARRERQNPWVRVQRGRTFFLAGSFDSSRAELQSALEIARRRDADESSFFYENKAAWEFSLGRVLEQLGHPQAARAAYERALTEDLSYYTAHIRLGVLNIEGGDTAAALREFARAVGAKDDEYLPRATYGFFLANTGRLDSAQAHIRRAIELEPYAAQPRMMLGAVLDAAGDAPGALAAFEQYLARASRNDPDLNPVQMRVTQLRAARR